MFRFIKEDTTSSGTGTEDVGRDRTDNINSECTVNENDKFHSVVMSEIHYQISREVRYGERSGIKHVNISDLLLSRFVQEKESVKKILDSTSDLVSGVYEGGFKIWECTFDLIKHLQENKINYPVGNTSRVLDLGCGSGLLGLYCLKQNALVDFHDYNSEVLNFLTMPNVLLNESDEKAVRCRFFSGSWTSFISHINQSERSATASAQEDQFKYDYILSSETVYNVSYLPSLHSLIRTCLKHTGIAFIAAKVCYFGVGGGSTSFKEIISQDPDMDVKILETFPTGVKREILSVTWKR